MAKKVVATLKTAQGKDRVKCIKMVKSDKKDSYTFKSEVVHIDSVKEFFAEKK